MHEPTTLLVERGRRLFLKQLRVPDHMAKRRAKVVGDRIGKRFQFVVAGFEVPGPLGELIVEFANFVFSALALFHLDLKMVASGTKFALDTAPNSYEPGNYRRQGRENKKVR